MKNFLEGIDGFLHNFEENTAKPFGKKVMDFVGKHPEVFALLFLAFMCLIFLFYGLSYYPLLDVDETRYAIMSRDLVQSFDWNVLTLNMEPFLEKPPLYFWLVAASIKLYGQFSELAVRVPIAACATFVVFFTYFVGRKIISRKFGLLSALILLSSVFFLIFSHVAIIDMVLTTFLTSSIYCGLLTHFVQDKNKKYCWWYFYLFAGVGFLAKGLLAIVIPVLIMFLYNWATKTLKQAFKPINLLPGLLIFFAVVIPWHLIMYKQFGYQFVKEYFLYHHFARFIDSAHIGRERPFLYFIPVFLLGFLPWTFVFIAELIEGCKKLGDKYKEIQGTFVQKMTEILNVQTNEQKLILFNIIYFLVIFFVVSSSSTKLPTYILPVFPAAALLVGYYWWISDEKRENEKTISITTQVFAAMFILAALSASIAYWVLPLDIQEQISHFKSTAIMGVYLLSIFLLLRLKTKNALSIFSAYIFTMIFVILLATTYIFNLLYNGGENEIVKYSSFANDRSAQLVTFDFAVKPSAMISYNEGKVRYITGREFDKLDKSLRYKVGPTFVIVKNSKLEENKDYQKEIEKRLSLVDKGQKYTLYVKENKPVYKEACKKGLKCSGDMKYNKKKHHLKRNYQGPKDFLKTIDGFNQPNPFEGPQQ